MTNRQYVIEACKRAGIDLCKPTKASPEIIGFTNGRIIIDALKWEDARQQLAAWAVKRAA